MQDAQLGSTVRHESLESHAQGKLAYVVRRGADGKGQRKQDLASSLPDLGSSMGETQVMLCAPMLTSPQQGAVAGRRTRGGPTQLFPHQVLPDATEFYGYLIALIRAIQFHGIRIVPGIAAALEDGSRQRVDRVVLVVRGTANVADHAAPRLVGEDPRDPGHLRRRRRIAADDRVGARDHAQADEEVDHQVGDAPLSMLLFRDALAVPA